MKDNKYVIISFILAIALIISLFSLYQIKVSNNKSDNIRFISDDRIPVTISSIDEQKYENIITYKYRLLDNEGQEVSIANSELDLSELLSRVNQDIVNIKHKICGMGVIDSTLYIQVDTRCELSEDLKVNIVTIKDNMTESDWIGLLEELNNTVNIHADMLLNYSTELGNIHYVYVYSDRVNVEG